MVRILTIACLAQLAVIVVLVEAGDMLTNSALPPQRPSRTQGGIEHYFRGGPGPWGDLLFTRVPIEPPDTFVPVEKWRFETQQWFFPKHSKATLKSFLEKCDLSPFQRASLIEKSPWLAQTNGIVVVPDEKLILELSATARSQIYSELSTSLSNQFQYWPYTFRNGGFDTWFQDSGLSPRTLGLVHNLVYTRGGADCFSDVPAIFPEIPTIPERRRLMKTLSRNSALLMELRLTRNSDLDALTAYWSKSGRARNVRPLLESLIKSPGHVTLDVMNLLPPFARQRLNTYPDPKAQPPADCYWSALNFFNDPPDDRFHDPSIIVKELESNYDEATTPTFGDVILLVTPDDFPIHSAVYIADNVVFTKNGGSERQPWLLMAMEDMLAHYPANFAVRTMIFRKRGLE